MDSFEASNIVFTKIRNMEPEYVARKIIGLILLEDNGEDMIRLAYGPDTVIQSLVEETKIRLGLAPNQIVSSPSLQPWDMQMAHGRMGSPSYVPSPLPIDVLNDTQNLNLESLNPGGLSDDILLNYYMDSSRQQQELECERPGKLCQYFKKGYCRNGSKCRFYHSPLYAPDHESAGGMFVPGSIYRLECEIYELLKSRRGSGPVSIATLPLMYYEKYGRNLQAEGYLTERQRHGKHGFNLTKLLERLRSIRLIDRPHGQHAVMLAEDALNGINIGENRGRSNPGPIVNGSRQIYLTFPAESIFTEEDVSDYFSNYGTVEDVRIPWQEERMFGFVNFADPETVKIVLQMRNPHYIGNARVLVKAYREKPQANNRNYLENVELRSCMNSYINPIDWRYERMLRRHIRDQERIFEIGKNLNELCIGQLPLANFANAIDDQNPIVNEAGHPKFGPERQFNYVVADDLSTGFASQDNPSHHGTINNIDNDSQRANFPDSPYEYPDGSNISTVTRQQEQN